MNWNMPTGFSGKASVNYQGQVIELKPKNIRTSKVEIFKDGLIVGEITFN